MMLHRIFTERLNTEKIANLTSNYFEGFTLIKADGYWKGVKEKSLIIEVITDNTQKAKQLAKAIKILNKQEAVFFQVIENNSELV